MSDVNDLNQRSTYPYDHVQPDAIWPELATFDPAWDDLTFKWLSADGSTLVSARQRQRWELPEGDAPGAWIRSTVTGRPLSFSPGRWLVTDMRDRLFLVETKDGPHDWPLRFQRLAPIARLVREVPVPVRVLRHFACDIAERVLNGVSLTHSARSS